MLHAADVLLLNEKPGVGDMAVPSKLTTYFMTGKPVVAATDHSSAAAAEIRAAAAGVVVAPGDPRALLEATLAIGRDKPAAVRFGKAGLEVLPKHAGSQHRHQPLRRVVS